ncbi:MAG: ACP S-malonyltransferase [Cryobacterium sp.]
MIVVVCPGQGSQTPGFLEPWLPFIGSELRELSDAAGIDLVAHGVSSDADTIRDTAVAQPLLVAAGILTLNLLLADGRRAAVGGIAGHSVGEITAAAGAGILTAPDALRFVRERGLAMQSAAALEETGMSAVLGWDEADLLPRLAELSLEAANFNGGGQVVAAGATGALAELAATPPARARVIPLNVAGAFHTRYMRPAADRLHAAAAQLAVTDPTLPIWTNSDGSLISDGTRFVDLLVGQVSSSVRWDRCMESFAAGEVTGIIEVAPAGALVGLAKRALRGVPSVAVKTPDDLPAAFALIDQHS